MSTTDDSSVSAQSEALDDLAAVDAARQSAVNSARRPRWLTMLVATFLGMGFGTAQLDTTLGWILGISLMVVGLVGFAMLGHLLSRRRGRLLNVSRGTGLRSVAMVATVFLVGQVPPPDGSQPWFALGLGVLLSVLAYVYLSFEDSVEAQKLTSGDFSPDDLLP